jgi:predicted MFS family arabinose efflux permease
VQSNQEGSLGEASAMAEWRRGWPVVLAAGIGVLPITPAGFYATAALMGAFASLAAVPTYTRAVASWFKRGTGLAFGIVLSGSALIAMVATPLTGNMIAEHGWRSGFLTIAGIMLLLGLPVIALFYRERKEVDTATRVQAGALGATLRETLRDARFWFYLLAFTVACIGLNGTLAHLQPMLAEKGFPLSQAISLGVLYALAMTAGKLIGGFLLDRIWPFAVAAGITTIAAAGSFGLATANVTEAYPLAALLICTIGMAQGAESDFVAYFVLRSFGMRAFSTIVGVLAMVVTLGLALGAWLYGVLFDMYGSYTIACLLGAGCLLASGVFVIAAGLVDRAGAHRRQAPT